ncbi:putative Ser/Thr protein kinase [Streptosporangium album]|uniref:Putative Ser/Thr protein kinase n=1 Tax=Streptosporangium album TaxID=47479 RepID=A0A7W7RR13_9ACTN|nr:serine/threonine-protein kinase [Streptosporangium album]MBB4936579.1 putative Ser/Thr protein kinase [Streptosporangium album]
MPDAQPLEPGDPVRLGAHRITGRIGEGGQGLVYLGESDSGDLVAIKLLHARLGQDPVARDDFARELEVAKRVARFCTAQVLDFGMSGSRPYIVSEYVPGPSLQQLVTTEGPRRDSALERLAIGMATALVALHHAGIVHRDLKPQNVLIGPDGPRVIDFGIARALAGTSTMTSKVVGTPAYMAPEQLSAGELGLALDVFAWASTVAFAATGRPPFGNDAIPAIINRILNLDPLLDGIEAPLRDLLAECLSKDPRRRPSAQQILDRLVRGRGGAPHAPQSHAAPLPGGAGGDDALRLPSRTGEAGASGRETTPGAADGAPAPGAPKRRRGTRAMVVSVSVAAVVVGGIALRTALVPTGGASASRTGSPQASQVSATTTELPEKPAGHTTPRPTVVEPSTGDPSPTPSPARLVEVGPGNFTAYCVSLGWEWVEYRETPKPGAYCVIRKGDKTMYLSQSRRDAGCRWRYKQPGVFHRFKNKSNYCYRYR